MVPLSLLESFSRGGGSATSEVAPSSREPAGRILLRTSWGVRSTAIGIFVTVHGMAQIFCGAAGLLCMPDLREVDFAMVFDAERQPFRRFGALRNKENQGAPFSVIAAE